MNISNPAVLPGRMGGGPHGLGIIKNIVCLLFRLPHVHYIEILNNLMITGY